MTTDAQVPPKGLLIRTILPVFLILAAIVTVLLLVKSQVRHTRAPVETAGADRAVPDFELLEFGRGPIRLSSTGAHLTILNFWASWCDGCVSEMPSLQTLASDYRGRGLRVFALNVEETPEKILPSVIRELKLTMPVYTDPTGKLADHFDVHALPFTVIMDPQRKILRVLDGEVDWNNKDLRKEIDKWLGPS